MHLTIVLWGRPLGTARAQGRDDCTMMLVRESYWGCDCGVTTTPLPPAYSPTLPSLPRCPTAVPPLSAGSGSLWASGDGNSGQLMQGSVANSQTPIPVALPPGHAAVAIAAGMTCSLFVLGRSREGSTKPEHASTRTALKELALRVR